MPKIVHGPCENSSDSPRTHLIQGPLMMERYIYSKQKTLKQNHIRCV